MRPHARLRPARGRSQHAELRPLKFDSGYAELQAAAKRCGLGTLDFRPITVADGAARYIAKYMGKSLGDGVDASIAEYSDFLPRRCGFSRNVAAIPPSPGKWSYLPKSPARILLELTGELREDDPDYVEWPHADPLSHKLAASP